MASFVIEKLRFTRIENDRCCCCSLRTTALVFAILDVLGIGSIVTFSFSLPSAENEWFYIIFQLVYSIALIFYAVHIYAVIKEWIPGLNAWMVLRFVEMGIFAFGIIVRAIIFLASANILGATILLLLAALYEAHLYYRMRIIYTVYLSDGESKIENENDHI